MSCEAREAMLWYELVVTGPMALRASSATLSAREC